MSGQTVFGSKNIDDFFDKVEKIIHTGYEGYTFFSPPVETCYNTYEIHFTIETGYDAKNSEHVNSLIAWFKDKVNITLPEARFDSISTQSKIILISFFPDLTNEEESSLIHQPFTSPSHS